MKKWPIFFIIFILGILPVYAEIVNGIAAKVGDGIITINEFNKSLDQMERDALQLGKNLPSKIDAINQLIDNFIVKKEAERRGIVVSESELDKIIEDIKEQNDLPDEDFKKELKKEGITLEDLKDKYRMEWLKARFINQLASNSVNDISEDEIRSFYEDKKNKKLLMVPAMVELSEIYIKISKDADYKEAMEIKDKANQIYEKARNGEGFSDLVKEYSMASNKDKDKPGYLGSFTSEQLYRFVKPEDVNLIFSMDKGEVIPPIRLPEGYYIFKVNNKRENRTLSFEEAYENIKRYLIKKKGEELYRKWIINKRNTTNTQIMIEME